MIFFMHGCFMKWFFLVDSKHVSTHPREQTLDRPKYRYHQNPSWCTYGFFGVIYRNMGEGILMGAEIIQTTVSPKLTPA